MPAAAAGAPQRAGVDRLTIAGEARFATMGSVRTAAVASRLAALTPDQRAAATAPAGPVLCVAPAGSGKTTTLVARIAWRVATGADPAGITALTFNRSAADELRGRLAAALEPLGVEVPVRVSTFHALGREILAEAGVDVNRLVDRATVIAELCREPLGAAAMRALDDGFSRLKLDRDPDGTAHGVDPRVKRAFTAYERRLAERGQLDFDDLVARALTLLEAEPVRLAAWRRKCSVLLVDEVQDLDQSQLRMALALAGPVPDVFLVGDDDQTIYAWRLADVRRVIGLAAALPGLRRVDLVTNHRCPAPVVERAVRLIEHNQERFAKRIRAAATASGELVLAPDPGDAVARARRLVRAWLGRRPGRHAVLARTNAELAPVAAAALEAGVAYVADADGLVLEDAAVLHVMDGLRARARREPGIAPWMALGPATAADGSDAVGAGRTAVAAWAAPFRSMRALVDAFDAARARRGADHADGTPLVLATAHATKGLEFDHVACIGLDEGTFPSARTLAESADPVRALEEERRLAYVAWTRARRSLTLVYDPYAPSPFLSEAFEPSELAA